MFVPAQGASAPTVFHFTSTPIRVLELDGMAWFVAGDVAQALNYRDAANLARVLDDDEKGTHPVSTIKGAQKLLIINESGLYHAVIKSRKPEAVAFRKWVTGTVLPAIRQSGRYEQPTRPACGFPLDFTASRRVMIRLDHNGSQHISPIPNDAYVLSRAEIVRAIGCGQDLPLGPAELAEVINGASGRLARVLGQVRA